jgi:hypothetical protein
MLAALNQRIYSAANRYLPAKLSGGSGARTSAAALGDGQVLMDVVILENHS